MAKLRVKTKAVIDRHSVGSEIELPKDTAEHLESIGYVQVLGEVKPKTKAKPKSTKSTKDKTEKDK